MNNDTLDASIPVLTEIIAQEQDFIDAAPAALNPSADETSEDSDPTNLPPSAAISDSQWQALEHKISERVLSQLQSRIDLLEHQFRDNLANAVQLAADVMVAEIRRGLHQTPEDGISSAAKQEIAQMEATNKPAGNPIKDLI